RVFQYAGSIGPLDCRREALESLGQTLVDAFALRGIFGVDFLFDGDRIRPVEVNPRYPASLEILERITRQPLLVHHFAAFADSVATRMPADTIETREPDAPSEGDPVVARSRSPS